MRVLVNWLLKCSAAKETLGSRRRIDFGDSQPDNPIYAIGDVHGCLEELQAAEAAIAEDMRLIGRNGLVVLLGDYVDRGPLSSQVLDHLIQPSEYGFKRICLCGNHDDLFLRFLDEPEKYPEWFQLGGEQTLMSYGINLHYLTSRQPGKPIRIREILADAVPATHRSFLQDLPLSLKIGNIFFVHAGIRPGIPLEEQLEEDLLWIREPFITTGPKLPSLLVIHGHTPQPDPDIGEQRLGIDTGAFSTGKLSVLRIESGTMRFLPSRSA